MRKFKLLLALSLLSYAANAQEGVIARNPVVGQGKLVRVADPFSKVPGMINVLARNEYGIVGRDGQVENDEYSPPVLFRDRTAVRDEALQSSLPNPAALAVATVGSNFDGMSYTAVCPADPTVSVGPNHVLQMINGSSGAYLKVWNKTGTQLLAQTYMDVITGKGGLGDPVALYDQLADRFVITEFANKPETGSEGLVVAVSKTNDPTGLWNVYFFSYSLFPDYPKFTVWHDGYYCKTNDFQRNRYKGATIWAFDRAAMLSGAVSASVQRFSLGTANKYFSMCPVGLSGATPAPSGTGGLFAYINDNTWSGSATDSVGLIECKVNFVTPANSVLVTKASLAVAANSLTAPTITQPGGGQSLDALANRVMNQPQYRNFGTSESIVLAHLVNSNNAAGVRWYELKHPANWAVNQQATYQPDANHRFMASININAAGDIGLAYNISSTTVFPSIRFTGRLACDPLNTMTAAESVLAAGTVSSSCVNRYGDYNHLVVDPADNSSFWMTGMYNKASSWTTRVGSFNLGVCGARTALTGENKPVATEEKTLVVAAGIFPVPARNVLNVILNKVEPNSVIAVIDAKGTVAMELRVTEPVNKINISKLLPGVYMLKISNSVKSEVYKFIKE